MSMKFHVNSWNTRTCVVDTAVSQFMHSPTVCWFLLDHPKQKKAKTISTSLAIIDSSQEKTFYSVWHAASPMLTQKYAISAVIALNFTHLSAFLLCKRGNYYRKLIIENWGERTESIWHRFNHLLAIMHVDFECQMVSSCLNFHFFHTLKWNVMIESFLVECFN